MLQMNDLKRIPNDQLASSLKSLVRQERELLAEILLHIAEVDRRRLHLKMAYPSLFEYLTKHLGYSAGSAQRRIDAARLSKQIPDLNEKLEAGSLSLAQVSLVQKALRQKKAHGRVAVDSKTTQSLLEDISNKSLEESQKIVAKTLDLEIKAAPKVQHQKDESVRLEITLSKEQWQKLQTMRELLSNSLPRGSGDWAETFEYVAEKVIQQKTKASDKSGVVRSSQAQAAELAKDSSAIESNQMKCSGVSKQIAKAVSTSVKKAILNRDQTCQYRDPKTQRTCGSKWKLQIDHIQPCWAGGGNHQENLQVLCASHNQQKYKEQAGFR